jgi:hypothetical protein
MPKVCGLTPESDTLCKTEEDFIVKDWCKVRTWHAQETSHGLCWAQQLDDDKADIVTSKTSPKDEYPKKRGVLGTSQPATRYLGDYFGCNILFDLPNK